ncbi:hypothetical protein IC575_009154 [Cucumis melo]
MLYLHVLIDNFEELWVCGCLWVSFFSICVVFVGRNRRTFGCEMV